LNQTHSFRRVEETAKETEQKTSEIMKTYLGENPDISEAIEFLCIAEAGGITHYEVLNAMTREIKMESLLLKLKQFWPRRKSICSYVLDSQNRLLLVLVKKMGKYKTIICF
jgi:hypothetical protein